MCHTSLETTNQYLIGIHAGGDENFVAAVLKKRGKFLPKWNTRIASFAQWIKCTQKNALDLEKNEKDVERACSEFGLKVIPPQCGHEALFYQGRKPYIASNDTYCP